jgi:hypothetical protein
VRLRAGARFAAHATGARQSHISMNGASFPGGGLVTGPGVGTVMTAHSVQTDVIDVVETDYFEFVAFQSSGGSLNLVHDSGNHTWFAIEVVEASI